MGDGTLDGGAEVTLAGDPAVSGTAGRRDRLAAGAVVGRYVLIGSIGVGGMGEVYAAYDPELDRKVALKLLHAVGGRDQTLGAARLQREAQALARLSHPNVVAVHDVGTVDGRVFVAMEFVDGQTFGEWLKAKPRSIRDVVSVLTDAGRGLAGAHAAGLVHRDFKPDNVMVRADGRVLVMDFGVARPTDEPSTPGEPPVPTSMPDATTLELTAAGALVGTPAYMAPEQHLGADVDARTDQFSFCVALYEAVYAERPFAGKNLAALAFHVAQGKVRDAPAGTKVSNRLRKVILRGLSSRRAQRFSSMEELLEALAKATRGRARLVLGVAGLVAIGLALAAGPTLERRQLAACEAQGSEIEEVWNDDSRARVGAGLEATAVEDSEMALIRLQGWLDPYVLEWAQVRTEACVAAEIRGDRSSALIQASEACLLERRDALEVLLTELSAADPQIARRASEAASGLPLVSACADEASLLARAAPPEGEAAEQVRSARRALGRAKTLLIAGHQREARAAIEDIAQTAAVIDYAPLSAEVALALGLVQQRAGEYEPARDTHEDAFAIALGVGSDALAVEAANRLLFLNGVKLAKYDDARRWERLGWELLRRIEAEDTPMAGALLHSSGTMALVRGEYEQAQDKLEQALAQSERILGKDHPVTANTLNHLGILALLSDDFETALQRHDKALEIRRRTVGPDHPMVAQSLNNRGNVSYLLKDYERAIQEYEGALRITEAVYGPEHPDVALGLNNIGNVRDDKGDQAGALEAYGRSLAIREKTFDDDHPMIAQSLHNMGIVERKRGNYERAREQLARAVEIKEKTAAPAELTLVQARIELGGVLLDLDEAAEARAQLETALAVCEKGTGDAEDLAKARLYTARALYALDAGDSRVRPLAQQALDGIEKGSAPDLRTEAEAFLASLSG